MIQQPEISFLISKIGQNRASVNESEIIFATFFLFVASIAYGWIGLNFAIDDRKLNKIISPLMIINSLFYINCIFYSFDFPTLNIIIFLIFSKAFWSIAIIPFANNYFKQRASYAKVSKQSLLRIIQVAINDNKLNMTDITEIGLSEYEIKNIVAQLEFSQSCNINNNNNIILYKDLDENGENDE